MKIPLFRSTLSEDDKRAVTEFIQTKSLFGGHEVALLEEECAQIAGVKHVIAVSSGTTALFVLFQALGIENGDDVIIPDFTWPSAANCSELLGANTSLLDVDPSSFSLPPELLESHLSSNVDKFKTSFIVAIHQFGLVWQLDKFSEIAKTHGAVLIEDSAWSLGSTIKLQGVAGIYSCHPKKVISAGEGGVIYTNDEDLAAKCRVFRNHGLSSGHFIQPALNARMPEIQACIIRNQLKRVDSIISNRFEISEIYRNILKDIPQITIQTMDSSHKRQAFTISLRDINREDVIKKLLEKGIATSRSGISTHKEPWFMNKYNLNLKNSATLGKQGLSLPMYENMNPKDAKEVADSLVDIISS